MKVNKKVLANRAKALPELGKTLSLNGMLAQDGQCLVKDRSVIQHHQSAIGTRFEVDTHALSALEIMATEEIADRLDTHIQLISNAVHAAFRQGILNLTQFVKGNGSVHIVIIFFVNSTVVLFLDIKVRKESGTRK